jgi:hypothetical protein
LLADFCELLLGRGQPPDHGVLRGHLRVLLVITLVELNATSRFSAGWIS